MPDKLDEIMAAKRREIAPRLRPVRPAELARLGQIRSAAAPFIKVLQRPDGLALIAEIKRRSPSAGAIAEQANAVEQARLYLNGQADALSVLTDGPYFGGSLRDLWDVVEFVEVHGRHTPCLRKDFMVHPLQVVEAAEAGARAILIIVRALADDEIKVLQEAAETAGLDCLFEVHDEPELAKALRFNPKIVGVNNRDLGRFVTDLSISERLLPQIPAGVVKVAESGIHSGEDAHRMLVAGANAVLVGESLMRADDLDGLMAEIRG